MPLRIDRLPLWTELVLAEPPHNILTAELLQGMVAALDDLAAAEGPLLVIRAEGRHFSTGYPIGEIPEAIFHRDPGVRADTPFEKVMDRLARYPSPVVAVVQGDAWGGAVELLACADMRVAAEGVRLGLPPVRLGLVYSHTGLRRLGRGLGSPLMREMVLTGEPVGAERLHRAGFFNRLVPAAELETEVTGILEAMTKGGPRALQGTRRVLTLLEETETLPADTLAEIAHLRHDSWSGDEFRRAREAFLAGGPPPFPEGTDSPFRS